MSSVFWLAYILGWCLRPFRKKAGVVTIISPANPGSLGDEAMVQSVAVHFTNTNHRVQLLILAASDDWSPAVPQAKQIGPIGDKQISAMKRWRKNIDCVWALIRSEEIISIGADLLDGNYDKETAFSRKLLIMLNGLAGAGCRVRVAGFSFNSHPLPSSVSGLRALMHHAKLFARDPRSFSRLKESGINRITLVADLAFLLEPQRADLLSPDDEARIEGAKRAGTPVIGINPFFKYADEEDLERKIAGMARLFSFILALDTRALIVVVPHDLRKEQSLSEHGIEKRVLSQLSIEQLRRVIRCSVKTGCAAAVRKLTADFTLAFSGRMHFTITCASQCTPTISLVYQDKFEGLCDHLQLDPSKYLFQQTALADDTTSIEERIRWLLTPAAQHETREHLAAVLPRVKALSQVNFS